jgi:hypothetical protein
VKSDTLPRPLLQLVEHFKSVKDVHQVFGLILYAEKNPDVINSPMLPQLKRDADGGLTLLIQNESPGNDKEANWLTAPKGPCMIDICLYWPKDKAVGGKRTAPKLKKAK